MTKDTEDLRKKHNGERSTMNLKLSTSGPVLNGSKAVKGCYCKWSCSLFP